MRVHVLSFICVIIVISAHGLPDVSRAGYAECDGYTFVYGGTQQTTQLLMVSPSMVSKELTSDAPGEDFVLFPAIACERVNQSEWRVFVHGGSRNGTASSMTLQLDVDTGRDDFVARQLNTTQGPASIGGLLEVESNGDLVFVGGHCPGGSIDSGLSAFELSASETDEEDATEWRQRQFAAASRSFPVCGATVTRVGGTWWFIGGQSTARKRAPLVSTVDIDTLKASVLQDVDADALPWKSPPHVIHPSAATDERLFIIGGGAPVHTLSLESGRLTEGSMAASLLRLDPYIVRPRPWGIDGTLVCGGTRVEGVLNNSMCDYVDDNSFDDGAEDADGDAQFDVIEEPYIETGLVTALIVEGDADADDQEDIAEVELGLDDVYADLPLSL
jgi:hypothetical protein